MNLEAVLTGDFHLKTTDKYGKLNSEGVNTRLLDRLAHIKKSVDYTIKYSIPYWICLGDVFDKINPPEFLRKAFFEIITPLIKNRIKIKIVIGNHDTDYKIHSFMADAELLSVLKEDIIQIISEPTKMVLDEVDCLFLPFNTDENISAELAKAKGVIVFGHFGVDGALVSGNEYVLSKGVKQSTLEIPRFSYLAHYHKPQKTSKWMYLGSIAKVDFGERNDKKGFVHLIAGPDNIKHKFIDVKDRIFLQHEIIESDDPEFKKLLTWSDIEGYIVKLIFIGEEDWYLRFNMSEIRSKILKTGKAHKLFIEHKTIYESRVRVPEIDTSSSWNDGIDVYCKREKMLELAKIGKEILNEVL